MRLPLQYLLVLLLTASGVLGIYEEQAGENDWHAELVGQLTDTQVLRKDYVVASTSSNVLATLRLDSGNIAWRQILHASDQLQRFIVLNKPSQVVSL